MSIYTVGNIGVGPMGSLTAGAVADIFGGTFAGLLFGCGSLLLAYFMFKGLSSVETPIKNVMREKGLTS